MIWVYSGDRPSNGAMELAKLPGFKRLRTGKFLKNADLLINWGVTGYADVPGFDGKTLNPALSVKNATNKLAAFKKMAEHAVDTVPFCLPSDHEKLKGWQMDDFTIVGRQTLTGHSGNGIIIIDKGEPIQPALLYTKYIFKEREFRVHVVNGKVIDTQKKIKDPDKEVTSWKVRSHANGFIFARGNINPSQERDNLAISACTSLDLDFGAVDIVEDKKGNFYVLEVNTAPGLEGQTITSYAEAFKGV